MLELLWAWLPFLISAVAVAAAGYGLCRHGERVGHALGLGGSWVGLAMIAAITSLPELVTGLSAVSIAHAPNVALGDALGSCVINLGFLVVADFLLRGEPLYRVASASHMLSAAFGVVMLATIGLGLILGHAPGPGQALPGGIGVSTPLLIVLYLVALRTSFRYERARVADSAAVVDAAARRADLRASLPRFAAAALVVALAGSWLPGAAVQLARVMHWNNSFVGTVFVAAATSLPELAVTLSALRMRALDLAVGNLLGSNLFNAVIVAIDDIAWRRGPLLAQVSVLHAVTVMSALAMTGLALIGLFYRPGARVLRSVGWVSIGMACVYVFNAYVVYLHG